jgi:hypothetical protein
MSLNAVTSVAVLCNVFRTTRNGSKTMERHQNFWLSVYQAIYCTHYVFVALINDEKRITSISSWLSECFAFRIRQDKWSRMRKACSNLSDATWPLRQSRAIKMLQKPFILSRGTVCLRLCWLCCPLQVAPVRLTGPPRTRRPTDCLQGSQFHN